MEFRTTFRQMEVSAALNHFAKAKILETAQKYVPNLIEIHLIFAIQNEQNQASCHVYAGEGFNVWVKQTSPSMFGAIEGLVNKLDARLRRHKDKLRSLDIKKINTRIRQQHDYYYLENFS